MTPETIQLLTVSIFIITYLLIIKFYDLKAHIIWISVGLILAIGGISAFSAWSSINWNVMGIYIGMLFIAHALVLSKIPDYIAIWIVKKCNTVHWIMLLVCLFTGILSIIIENVACVLIVAPIIFSISKKLKISPVPMIIGASVSSNLQGVATLVGDPPSMLLAAHTGMDFNDFFFYTGRPGLFFAVQIGMIASLIVLYFFFRRYDHKFKHVAEIKTKGIVPAAILVGMIITLIVSSTISGNGDLAGIICLIFGLMSFAWIIFFDGFDKKRVFESLRSMDWTTGFFIIGVFILVESLTAVGAISEIADFLYNITGNSLILSFLVIVGFSVIFSAFVDNVPYIVAMLPVTQLISEHSGVSPTALYFGLLIGASVGGNITPIGASANIVGSGILKSQGYKITFWDFVKIGLPFTLVAVAASAGFIWFVFG